MSIPAENARKKFIEEFGEGVIVEFSSSYTPSNSETFHKGTRGIFKCTTRDSRFPNEIVAVLEINKKEVVIPVSYIKRVE